MKMVKFVKRILMLTLKIVFQGYYRILSSVTKLDDDKVVIVLSRSAELEGNLKFIHDEVKKQKPTAKIHFIYSVNKMNLKLFKELFIISNAKYLILDDYFLPIYLIKPKKQMKVIQLWHAAGAFKKFGHSTVDKKFGPDASYLKIIPVHSNYTHVYVSSVNAVEHFAEAFNMPTKHVYPIGIPRTDLFACTDLRKEITDKILNEYEMLNEEKTIILFAPTYRAANQQRESEIDFVDILFNISQAVAQDKIIVYKPHPYLINESLDQLKNCENILIADKFTINDWMLVSDAFITDYSSAIFEYGILEKPLAHFVPDLLEYETGRGLYYPIEEISDGEIIKNDRHLIEWINSRSKDEVWDTKKMTRFNFTNIANTSKKITSHFLNH